MTTRIRTGASTFVKVILLTSISMSALAQSAPFSTLQNVVPPSPEAISFARQNFADVNLYAGKHSYSIPLYTMSQSGISFPITLNYTGGGGIKVEEVASSVGLGWSLQYTGVVTRSIRGQADDVYAGNYIGYIHLPGLDSTMFNILHPNWSNYNDGYRAGKHDAQPDIYFVNAPGVSAMFYINKLKKVVFVEKSDLKIDIRFSGYSITGFDVVDLNGNVYVFDVIETNRTVRLDPDHPSEYNASDVSAWYLSKIKNHHGKVIFNFHYQSYHETVETKQLMRIPYQYTHDNQQLFREDHSTYTEFYNKRPLLQKISSASSEVDFKMSQDTRRDFESDRSIDSIIVKNYLGRPIRKFNFEYSYFTASGTVTESEAHQYGTSSELRLKLDTLEITGTDDAIKEIYGFSCNTDQLLPDRLSTFAMDHWGYYNGVSTNTTWEARHRQLYYEFDHQGGMLFYSTPVTRLAEFGTANREPNEIYAQACILTQVTTPMGGKIRFEYEGNTSNHPGLPNTIVPAGTAFLPDSQKNYFSINMIREPFAYVRVASPVSEHVSIEYTLRDSLENSPPVIDTLILGNTNHYHKLQNGTYYLKARVINFSPDTSYYYDLRFYKDVETLRFNKPVGGLRIKKMDLINPVSGENYNREYYYNEAGSADPLSPSTGVISRIPNYGYQHVTLVGAEYPVDEWTEFAALPLGYTRQLSSTYPLVASSGSYAGYEKVTTIDSDSLKSEFHYTSFSEFPQLADGFWEFTSFVASNKQFRNGGGLVNGEWFEIHPFAPDDERDYFRGKLTKETYYKSKSGAFRQILSKEYRYIFNYITSLTKEKIAIGPDTIYYKPNFEVPDFSREVVEGAIFTVPSPTSAAEIIANMCCISIYDETTIHITMPCDGCTKFKRYRLHTGKYDLHKTIQKTFTYSGIHVDSLVVENTLEYGQAPWSRDSLYHYVVTKAIRQTSTGADTTLLYYPFDWRYTNPEINIADTSFLRTLEKQNRIGLPFIEKKISDGTHVLTTKNLYTNFNTNQLNPNTIQVKGGAQPAFENRIFFNKYDTLGNILEQQKANDQKQSYLWGYKNTYVIAQATNADYEKIAYTSFEPDSPGNWIFAGSGVLDSSSPTGAYSYTLSGSMTRSGMGTGKFIVSYWKKNGSVTVNGTSGAAGETINGWTYYEHSVTDPSSGTITVSGTSALIDELRLYPEKAQMTTYTYTPLVGVTSQCDANNMITSYEYDSFGRLSLVKDHHGNIIQHMRYHITNSQTY